MHTQIVIVEHGDKPPFEGLADGLPIAGLAVERVAVLQGGMLSGAASVAFVSRLANQLVVLEMSADHLEMLASAVRGARQRWGEAMP